MKAISLWQPWASAIAFGAKHVETRSWGTNYRGPLLIHAAKRKITKKESMDYFVFPGWHAALWPYFGFTNLNESLPFGALIAKCNLTDCRPTEDFLPEELEKITRVVYDQGLAYTCTEKNMGDFSPGRFGWILEDIIPIGPIPWKGRQGFFNVSIEDLNNESGQK